MAGTQPRIPIVSSFDNKGVREAQSSFRKLGDAAKTTAKAVGILSAAFGAAALTIGKKAVDAASDLSESVNAVNVTFGEAADGILGLSEASAQAVGLSSREFNAFAVQFGAFSKQIAGAEGDVVGVTDELTTRIADFASVMNLDVPDAAAVFQSSLAGETEPIRRFGIDLSAAAVELFALESGLINSKGEMTEAIKVQARYGLLMQSTEQMAGDFANTSDGLANQQRILAAEFDNAQARLGTYLLPAMESLVGLLVDRGIPALNSFIDWLGPKLEPAAQAFASGVETTIDRLGEFREQADDAAASIRDNFNKQIEKARDFVEEYNDELEIAGTIIASIVTGLVAYQTATAAARGVTLAMTAAQLALSAAMSINPMMLLVIAIAALVAGIVIAYQRFEPFRELVNQVFEAIKQAGVIVWEFLQGAWATLVAAFETIMPTLQAFYDAVVGFFTDAFATVTEVLSSWWESFQEILGPVAGWFMDNVVSTIQAAIEFFIALFERIIQVLEPVINTLIDLFKVVAEIVIDVFGTIITIIGDAFATVTRIITGFIDYIRPVFELFWDALKSIVQVAFEVIENTVEVALAIIRGLFEIGTALLKGDFGAVWDAMKGIVSDAFDAIKDLVTTSFGVIVEFVAGVPEKIGRAAKGMFNGIKDAFREAINFIIRAWNGLEFRIPGFSIGPIGYDGFTLGVPDIPLLADGGIVNRATLAVIGEAGPEAVVPLDQMRGGIGGATYNITVQAGVGDPGMIGQSVVDAITAYERRNGAGWRAA
jgi:phage-related protein